MNIRLVRKENLLSNELFWVLMLFVYFEPAYFSQLHYLDRVFDVMKVISFSIVLFLMIKGGKYPYIFLTTLLYYAFMLSITYIKAGDVKTIGFQFVSAIGAVVTAYLMSVYIRENFISCILIVFELLIYGNCLSVLVAPHGLYRFRTITGWWTDACWLLGIRNGMTLTYIIGFYLEWMNYHFNKKARIRFIIYMIIASFTIVRINFSSSILIGAGSAGGLVTCWLCILAIFVLPKNIPLLNFTNAFLLDLVFFVLLVFFRIQRMFSFFIEKLLHKTVSLSGRVHLWEKAINVIADSPIWGYGAEYGVSMAARLKTPASVNTTQNGFLDIFYTGGIALFGLFMIMIFICAYLINTHYINQEISTFIGYVTFVFFLCCQSESMIGVRFFFFLQLLILSNAYIQEEYSNEKGTNLLV
ncbi:O-antigen ligase family protein [Butyrivibrio sp. NC2002]|uniref:O-antigen ligase family protein n=1 Tax=Butyrivibrio sp. NC2002 TaxID=1410610 RepID=UPI00055ECBA6|nr:O-antigen ligase family protein [Butyrivibrio sp. NC2002]